MKKSGMLVPLFLAVLALVAVGALGTPTVRVIYNHLGNALLVYGGDKQEGGSTQFSPESIAMDSGSSGILPFRMKHLSASKSKPYGDSYVYTAFDSTLLLWAQFDPIRWVEVYGESETSWLGFVPQYYSSQITFAESWTFNGWAVSLSFPSGVGLSGSGKTVNWSASDASGAAWSMRHQYDGLRAESYLTLSSVRQSSAGSHMFIRGGIREWVTTYASAGIGTYYL